VVALPAQGHIVLECPVCDQPVRLPLIPGPQQGRTIQLVLDTTLLNEHLADAHFDLLVAAAVTPPPAAEPG